MGRCVDGVAFLAGFVGERMLQVLDVPEKTQLNHGEHVQRFFSHVNQLGLVFFNRFHGFNVDF